MNTTPQKIQNTFFNKYDIPHAVMRICRKLKNNGYTCYLVGGCVRDLLIGNTPKDFDVSTNARPEDIKKIFKKKCRLIGRRFKLAHIYTSPHNIVEVSTFRSCSSEHSNVFGTEEEDAFNRDITINAIYYDVIENTFIDYVGGLEHIQQKRIAVIGTWETRIIEDPARMIRLIRYTQKTGFSVSDDILHTIQNMSSYITQCSESRLFEELKKDLSTGHSFEIFCQYHKTGLFSKLFPSLFDIWNSSENSSYKADEVFYLLQVFDEIIAGSPQITIGFTALFFPFFNMLLKQSTKNQKKKHDFMMNTAEKLIGDVARKYQMPKYIVNQCCYNISSFELLRQYALHQRISSKLTRLSKRKEFHGILEFYDLLNDAISEYFLPVQRAALLALKNKRSRKPVNRKRKKNKITTKT